MADPVYKRVTDLDAATLPLATGDEIPVSQSGATKKATFGGIFGSGWFAKLFAPLASFVAPEATHATDADTCGTESSSDFHDAAQLTGAIHLDRIPAELTGKNAATATTLTSIGTNRLTELHINGGRCEENSQSLSYIFTELASTFAVGDGIRASGAIYDKTNSLFLYVDRLVRYSTTVFKIYGLYSTGQWGVFNISQSDPSLYNIAISW